jgi:hypothetical protein
VRQAATEGTTSPNPLIGISSSASPPTLGF